jgi:cytochrome c biogenesis protein CcmG/thiol:disulfide interchange protein DsbE
MTSCRRSRRLHPSTGLRAVLGVAAALFAACAPGSAGPVGFRASGPAAALPAEVLAPVDAAGFEAVMVGLRGRPVVVNVWASWCGPCRVEAPLLQRAADRYGDEVVFLGVDSKDSPGPARDFLDRYGITYPNVTDADGGVRRLLRLRGFPTTYVFGRDGRLLAGITGGISEQALAATVGDALRR